MIRWPMLTLAIALALAAGSLLAIVRLRVDTSLGTLFNQSDPAAGALLRMLGDFRSVEELLILAEADSAAPAKLTEFAARLDAAIQADPVASQLCDGVIYRVSSEQRQFFEQVLVPNGLFYLDDAAFAAAQNRLTREQMDEQLRRDETLISAPGASALAKVLLQDPLRLREFVLDQVAASRPMQTYQNSDAFLSKGGSALLIRIRGRRPVSDLEFAKRFTETARAIADRANTDHLNLSVSGAYAIAAASERAIRRDMIETVISSVVGLQLLFIVAYRRPIRSFVLAFLPVAVGVVYGFGTYALLSRTLTPMTAVIGGVLAGMSIDYAIAFLSFYQSQRAAGQSAPEAGIAARRRIGTAILAAYATSIIGFVVIGFSHVSALRDFALLASLALTGAFGCAILLLPALLAIVDRRDAESMTQRTPASAMLKLVMLRPRCFAIGMVILFVAALATLALPGTILPLDSDLSVMHPTPNPPLDAQNRIAERMGFSPGSMVVYLHADSAEQLLTLAHQVEHKLRTPPVREAGIVGTFGLATLLPDPAVAPARIAAIGPKLADRVVADFTAAVEQSIFDPASAKPYIGFLRHILTATAPPGIADLVRYPSLADSILPAAALKPGAAPPTEAITLVLLRQDTQQRAARDLAIDAVRNALGDLPGATVTGLGVLNHDTEFAVRRDLPRLVIAAVVIATLYLAIHFRNAIDCILAMLPTLFGLICLLAFMRLTGQTLNMVNLVAFPLLVGIDVDYGIFLVSALRWRELRGLSPDAMFDRLLPAASAVLICAVATTLGFGSLAFTSIPAVQSLGVAVAVGVISCLAGGLLLVVPILLLIARRRGETA